MIIVLHGSGLVSLNKKLAEIKQKFDPLSTTSLSGKEVSLDQALLNISSLDLFAGERLLILEEFGESVNLEKFPNLDTQTVVFKFSKKLPSNSQILKSGLAKKAQILFFEESSETSIFPFLDALSEKNPKAYADLEKLLPEYGSQYILTMIFYNLRKFVLPFKGPSFVLQKLQKQRINFPLEKIEMYYQEALNLDFKIKMGLIEDRVGLNLLVAKFLT